MISDSRDVPKQASRVHHRPEPGGDDLTAVVRMTRPPSESEAGAAAATVALTIRRGPVVSDQGLNLAAPEAEQSSLADLEHPVTAYLNGLAPSSGRPQLTALEAIRQPLHPGLQRRDHALAAPPAWAICKERGRKAGIQPPAPHDLRRTWTGDLLEAGVHLATVQKMAGHASVSTTGRYDRRDHTVQRKAAGQLLVPYVVPED